MLDFLEISIDDIWEELKGSPLIQNVLYDDFTEEDCNTYLNRVNTIAIHDGRDLYGFFTYEDHDCGEVEVHLFIYEAYRGKTKEVIEAVKDELFKGYGFKRIITTVSGNHPHVLRYLKMCHFKIGKVLKDFIQKDGQPYDVNVLVLEGNE